MSELKTGDKIVQQMTRDGAVEVNKATGGAERISARETDVSPASSIVSGVVFRVQTERRAAKKKAVKKANRKIFESVQCKPETSRLNFTDAERKDPAMSKVIQKSNRAADCYEKARTRIVPQNQQKRGNTAKTPANKTPAPKLVSEKPAGEIKPRLVFREREKPPNGNLTHVLTRPGRETAALLHREVGKREDENSGIQAAHFSERAAESAAGKISAGYSRLKFEPQHQMLKAEEKAVNANVNAIYRRDLQAKPELEKASVTQKAAYKRKIKKDYTRAFRQGDLDGVKKNAEKIKNTAKKASEKTKQTAKFAAKNWKLLAIIGGILGLLILLTAGISSCVAMFGGGGTAFVGTSYTAEDADILGADADYATLETNLAAQIANIPSSYPGYDEYNFYLDPIEHDPFELASYLTAKYDAYTQSGVQAELAAVFAQQYRLTLTAVTEIRYRTETHTSYYYDGEDNLHSTTYTVQVPYNYYTLSVTLVNYSVGSVALSSLTPEQYEIYLVYMATKGNKSELFP